MRFFCLVSELTAGKPIDGVRGIGEVVGEDGVGSLICECTDQRPEAIDEVLSRVCAQALVAIGAARCGKGD